MAYRALYAGGFTLALLVGCGDDDPAVTSTTGSGGGSTGGAGGSGGGDAIVADPEVWTWVPVDDAICGNGTPTGIGINPSSTSSRLLIYLQGGGVCYDQATCLGPNPTASNVDGFGTAEFEEFTSDNGVRGVFDRTDSDNPFADFNFVFVPYCTGDVHAGNNMFDGINFVGQRNIETYLQRVLPTFPEPEQVVLTGASAGGFGSMYNFYLVSKAFEPAPTMLVDDSGPFLPLSATPQLAALMVLFALDTTIPPGCDLCLDTDAEDGGLHQLIPYYAESLPGQRASLISSLQDGTIASNFDLTGMELEAALTEVADQTVPQHPDFRVYYLSGSHHVWLHGGDTGVTLGAVTSNGVTLSDFLRQQIEGDAGWSNVRP